MAKSVVTTKADRGQKIVSSYPQDCSGSMDVPNSKGGSLGGSTTNLAHSLSGASAVQKK